MDSNEVVIEDLESGNIVRHKTGTAYIVIQTHPVVIAVRTVTIENAIEWELVKK